ncbi:MAG: radical SAM protein [Chloroflexi bacterium]|nr:radical SAM protein [Chloroflexota bacterium]
MVSLATWGSALYTKAKLELAENLVSQAINLLGHSSEKNHYRLATVLAYLAHNEQQRQIAGWVREWMAPGSPGSQFLNRVFQNIHPNVRKKYIAQTIVNLFFRDPGARNRFKAEHGFAPPGIMVISPSMRCNYRCVGCWAGQYTKKDDLPEDVFDRLLTEAKEMGIRYFVLTGGEPLVYEPLLRMFKKHDDAAFQMYTNGSLIDERMAEKLVELGNVAPQISIEGFQSDTDLRRGQGAFGRCLRAMDNLSKAGGIFAFSCMVSRQNIDIASGEEFIDLMIEKGAMTGWYFLYMPIGRNPDLSYMPTPQQRSQLRQAVERMRRTKPILLADFWGDSALTGGCIASGRIYLHVNHKGDVEPCVFNHFATHNIKECSLAEALTSPFLQGLRGLQPYGGNTLLPCPLIDHPQIQRMAVQKWGAYPTHEGAESLVTWLSEGLDDYSTQIHQLYHPIWEEKYRPWAEPWKKTFDYTSRCFPPVEDENNGCSAPVGCQPLS